MSNPRNIPVKVYLDADTFVALQNRCRDFGISHSSLFRSFAMLWTNDRAEDLARNSTALVPVWAQGPTGGRVNFGSAPVHLRL